MNFGMAYTLLSIYFVVSVAASFRTLRSDYFGIWQKVAQISIVWLLPVIGGVILWMLHGSLSRGPKRASRKFGGGPVSSGNIQPGDSHGNS